MAFFDIVKQVVRIPFRAAGFDLVRLVPGHISSARYQFEPREEDRYRWLSALQITTVLDIGAHQGEFAQKIHRILPDAAIVSFEPIQASFRELSQRMSQVSKFKGFNVALGNSEGRAAMNRNEFTQSSSLLRMTEQHKTAFPFTATEHDEHVDVRRLDDMVDAIDLSGNILIKIDVQGAEREMILGGIGVVARAKVLIVETSFTELYAGQPLFDDINDLLRAQGFRYRGSLEQLLSPKDGSALQADAIYLKVV